MQRPRFLAVLCSAGAVPTAGCETVPGDRTLSEPTVTTDSPGKRTLVFTLDGGELRLEYPGLGDRRKVTTNDRNRHNGGGTRNDA